MTSTMKLSLADKLAMQHRLFAELSSMFGGEVPLYDKSLLVNKVSNETVCEFLALKHRGFGISEEELEKASGERHGAIRIGTPEEYRLVAGFFDVFAMLPHNFYDMTSIGAKSQPIIATSFRSALNPEHRVFSSLLMIDYFDDAMGERIKASLEKRKIFSDRARELVQKNDMDGGLSEEESEELIQEGVTRIFKWTGKARDHALYTELSESGFKIAADIACFESHHLNHLTPNTLCMDLYTAAMKFVLGEWDKETFTKRAAGALSWLGVISDRDYMRLHFRHLGSDEIAAYRPAEITEGDIERLAGELTERLSEDDLQLSKLNHSGFKDFTEGPSVDTPILLRQDAYKALTEPVVFHEEDGSTIDAVHTARFGEIEQRFYATTPEGRSLYDQCLDAVETLRVKDPTLIQRDFEAFQAAAIEAFSPFPKTLAELLEKKLVFGLYAATAKGVEAAGSIGSVDVHDLLRDGYLKVEGLRYEDFLPLSAAGIFSSNLGQYGTLSTAEEKRTYSQQLLEEIMGRSIIDPNIVYGGRQAQSLLDAYKELGLDASLPAERKAELEDEVDAYEKLIS